MAKTDQKYAFHYAPQLGGEDFLITGPYLQGDDEIVSLHFHDALELGICREGWGTFVIGHRAHTYQEGDGVIIRSGTVHLARSARGSTSLWRWIYLSSALLEGFPLPRSGVYSAGEHPGLCREIDALAGEWEGRNDRWYPERVRSRLTLVLSQWGRRFDGRPGETAAGTVPFPPALTKAMDLIHNEYWQDLTAGELGERSHISSSGLYRQFVRCLGLSPKEYLDKYRVRMACGALSRGNPSHSALALDLGFGSVSSFNRVFKRVTGMAPREFQQAERALP